MEMLALKLVSRDFIKRLKHTVLKPERLAMGLMILVAILHENLGFKLVVKMFYKNNLNIHISRQRG